MQTGQLRSTPALLLILAGFGASGTAAADDPYSAYRTPHSDWSLFAGANFTDNATLAPNGPSDTIATGRGPSLPTNRATAFWICA